MSDTLMDPDSEGCYRYPDKSSIYPAWGIKGRWYAHWSNRHVLKDVDELDGTREVPRLFSSPDEAARALREGGEGPVSIADHVIGSGI